MSRRNIPRTFKKTHQGLSIGGRVAAGDRAPSSLSISVSHALPIPR